MRKQRSKLIMKDGRVLYDSIDTSKISDKKIKIDIDGVLVSFVERYFFKKDGIVWLEFREDENHVKGQKYNKKPKNPLN